MSVAVHQGRYILSHAETVDFKAISDALKAEFPELDIQDTESKPPFRVLDNSKVCSHPLWKPP